MKRFVKTSDEDIARLKPKREECRPPECKGDRPGAPCWVEHGIKAWSGLNSGLCKGCCSQPLVRREDIRGNAGNARLAP